MHAPISQRRIAKSALSLALLAALSASTVPSASAASWTQAFHTPDRHIQCSASMGAHGPGVECVRDTDGRGLTVQWSGVLNWPPKGSKVPIQGAVLAYGKMRKIGSPVKFACKSYHSAVSCWDTGTHHGFLIGLHTAKTF
jgi:hypothetical protein